MNTSLINTLRWAALLLGLYATGTLAATTERVSVDSNGNEVNSGGSYPAISANGRYVTFTSIANNLVAGDNNGTTDIFVHDRTTNTTERVSVASNGNEANLGSYVPAINADGRYVIFRSDANNLVAGDNNGFEDVFVHDRTTNTTERVSVASSGNEANLGSYRPAINADGRYVTFASHANNLVTGDNNGFGDVFVHDRTTNTTERVSVASNGTEANFNSDQPAISADGRYVTFSSNANNLVAGDNNGTHDIFVHDRINGSTERVSVDSNGTEANLPSYRPAISADGRYVTFRSSANILVAGDNNSGGIFVHDRTTKTTEQVSVASGDQPAINADGRYVTFQSSANNLVAGDNNGKSDVFVHDRTTNTTERVSVDSNGNEGNGYSNEATISADGRYVTFQSLANNLVAGDNNGWRDIFVHSRIIDSDADGIADDEDNCPTVYNPDQAESNLATPGGDACADPDFTPPKGVEVPTSTIIEANVMIDKGVVLGENVILKDSAVVKKNTTLGDNVILGETSTLNKNTVVGSDTVIGSGVSINKGVYIGSAVTIGDAVSIGRDSVICDDVTIANLATIGKDVLVQDDPALIPDVAEGDTLKGEKRVSVDPGMCPAP